MMKFIVWTLKIVGLLVALLLVLLTTVFVYVNTSAGQQRLLRFATDLLQEKLETRVQIDSVNVDFGKLNINLLGFDIEDRQQRKLLQAEHLAVKLDWKKLLDNRVEVESANIDGLRAQLYTPKDSATNFQFIIDAFKSDKPKTEKPKTQHQLALDIHKLILSNIYVEHHGVTKKGYNQTTTYSLSLLTLKPKHSKYLISVDSLRYTTDNHQPRKNTGRPHRGYFDAGHLDITANLELTVNYIGKDTANVSLTRCTAQDSINGFFVKDLRFSAGINKNSVFLQNFVVQHVNTTVSFDSATIKLSNKKQGQKLEYRTSVVTGSTLLKDIARPFAPALSRFSIPVQFKTTVSGTDSTMVFRGVHVNTADQKLKVDASGQISHLQDSKKLFIRFNVSKMTTNAVTAKHIIDQFTVKKFMMRQLNNLGSISYRGSFDVLYKMEKFRGVLNTSKGYMAFNLVLNENTKYLYGNVSTKGFQLGQVIEMNDIGQVGCNANFTFDYSKPRTAKIRKQKGGKLPIGKVTVTGVYGSYKKIKISDISAEITSNGVVAEGRIMQKKKYADVLCNFTFNNTDSIHKMKIKPGLRLYNMPWQNIKLPWQKKKGEEKLSKEEADAAKAAKKAEKAARKEEKKAAKSAKKAEKEAKKAEKAAKKAAEKAKK